MHAFEWLALGGLYLISLTIAANIFSGTTATIVASFVIFVFLFFLIGTYADYCDTNGGRP